MNEEIEVLIRKLEIKDFHLWVLKNFEGKELKDLLFVIKQYEESKSN